MALVVDASVVFKWVVEEDGSAQARALIDTEMLVAPDVLLVECANALWVKARRKFITKDDAIAALHGLAVAPIRIVPSRHHVIAAQSIAFELDQTAYDSLYLAVALAERSVLVSADERFCRAAAAHPLYRASVRLLGAPGPG